MKKVKSILTIVLLTITFTSSVLYSNNADAYYAPYSRRHYTRHVGYRHFNRRYHHHSHHYVRRGYRCIRGCRQVIYR